MSQATTQAKITAQAAIDPGQGVENLALFNEDGSPFTGGAATPDATTTVKGKVLKAAAVNTVLTGNATDLATAITLVNALKATVNDLVTKLKDSGSVA